MAKNGITKGEVNRRGGYIILALGTVFVFPTIKDALGAIGLPDAVIGIGLIFAALFFFEF